MSVAYIGPNSRKTKIGTKVAHVTRDSDTTFQGQKVKGQFAGVRERGHTVAASRTACYWLTSYLNAALDPSWAAFVAVRHTLEY